MVDCGDVVVVGGWVGGECSELYVCLVGGGYGDYWFVFGGGVGVGFVCGNVGVVGRVWLGGGYGDEWVVVGYFVGMYGGWCIVVVG